MYIFNKSELNNLLKESVLKRKQEFLKKYKNKDVQKCFLEDLKERQKQKIPFNFFFLNQLNNYSLLNKGVEITEDDYYYFLGILPPKYIKNKTIKINKKNKEITKEITNAFAVSEPNAFIEYKNEKGVLKMGSSYNAFYRTSDGKYYCGMVVLK